MKKYLAILVILVMFLTFISSCSDADKTSGNNEVNNGQNEVDNGQEEDANNNEDDKDVIDQADAEPLEILWAINDQGTGALPQKDGVVVKTIEEKFNVDITFFDSNYIWSQEQFNIKLASGEIPDVWYDYGHNTWWEQGIIRTITEEMIAQNMPKTYNDIYMEQDPDKNAFKVRTVEGDKLLGLPSITVDGASCFLRVYRQDWLDNLELEVPTTLEELENVVMAFTKDDPDGNGKDDTYALNTEAHRLGFCDVFGAFGIVPNTWILKDGEVVRSDATEEYKEALKIIARWYKEGYINPECLTDTFDTFTAKFADGQVGSYYLNWYWISPDQNNSPTYMLLQKDPNAKLVYGDAIQGSDGKSGAFGYGPDLGWTVVFRKDLSDEVVVRIMQIIEFFNSSDEGFKLHAGGIEGETYNIGEDGMIKSSLTTEEMVKEGINVFPQQTDEKFIPLKWGTGETGKIFELGLNQNWISSAIGNSPLVKAQEEGIGADIGKVYDEFYWNVITGKVDADTEWDAYLKELKDNGLDELTEEANEIYNAMYKN